MSTTATVRLVKVAWIRDASVSPGRPAKGKLNCRCGAAPLTDFNAGNGDVRCGCGKLYTWDGWLK